MKSITLKQSFETVPSFKNRILPCGITDTRAQKPGIRIYAKFIGIILALFKLAVKLEAFDAHQHKAIWYVNRKSLDEWKRREKSQICSANKMEDLDTIIPKIKVSHKPQQPTKAAPKTQEITTKKEIVSKEENNQYNLPKQTNQITQTLELPKSEAQTLMSKAESDEKKIEQPNVPSSNLEVELNPKVESQQSNTVPQKELSIDDQWEQMQETEKQLAKSNILFRICLWGVNPDTELKFWDQKVPTALKCDRDVVLECLKKMPELYSKGVGGNFKNDTDFLMNILCSNTFLWRYLEAETKQRVASKLLNEKDKQYTILPTWISNDPVFQAVENKIRAATNEGQNSSSLKPINTSEVTKKEAYEGKKLEVSFITKVTEKVSKVPQELFITDTGKKNDGYPVYKLYTKDNVCLGKIEMVMHPQDKHVYINYMCSYLEKFQNVGRALHEFAIRKSYECGYEGRVELSVAWDSEVFHYKCGYRFKYLRNWTGHLRGQIGELWKRYTEAKNKNEDVEAIVKQIQSLKDQNDAEMKEIFDQFEHCALERLKRPAENIKELLEYGSQEDMNIRLENSAKTHNQQLWTGAKMILGDEARASWSKIIQAEKQT